MLLMRSLTQRRAGKVVNSSVRYADVKPVNAPPMPQWLQATVKNPPVAVETPSTSDLGVQAGVYGALMALTYVNGTSTSSLPYGGADVPGLILAGSFGASLYFMTKKNIKLGMDSLIESLLIDVYVKTLESACKFLYNKLLSFHHFYSYVWFLDHGSRGFV